MEPMMPHNGRVLGLLHISRQKEETDEVGTSTAITSIFHSLKITSPLNEKLDSSFPSERAGLRLDQYPDGNKQLGPRPLAGGQR